MKISLGTVQFGLNYGITNTEGKVPEKEVAEILSIAKKNNINVLDTAAAYGTSEKVLGSFDLLDFKVISKISNITKENNIQKQVERSLQNLRIDKLYGIMLHSEQDSIGELGKKNILDLIKLKDLGLVEKIGVSFYSPTLALDVLNDSNLDLIQVPANQLDNRFKNKGVFSLLQDKKVELHVRSLFLQGLLAVSEENRPKRFKENKDIIRFDQESKNLGLTNLELALYYLIQNPEINYGVVGCQDSIQFKEIITSYQKIKNLIVNSIDLTSKNEKLINPSLW